MAAHSTQNLSDCAGCTSGVVLRYDVFPFLMLWLRLLEGARGVVARGYPSSAPSNMPVLNKGLPQQ